MVVTFSAAVGTFIIKSSPVTLLYRVERLPQPQTSQSHTHTQAALSNRLQTIAMQLQMIVDTLFSVAVFLYVRSCRIFISMPNVRVVVLQPEVTQEQLMAKQALRFKDKYSSLFSPLVSVEENE